MHEQHSGFNSFGSLLSGSQHSKGVTNASSSSSNPSNIAAANRRRLAKKYRNNLVRQVKVGDHEGTGGDNNNLHACYELDDIHYISESDNNS